MTNELLDAAIGYAERNWRVIPLYPLATHNGILSCSCFKNLECRAPGKHPVFSKWREVATTNVQKLKAWWKWKPRLNIGILMGGEASIIGVDVDGEDGRESLRILEEQYGELPATLTQSTGRENGGEHRIFHVDPFYVDWIRNRTKLAPGIDFRGQGGYLVSAPSAHVSGTKYRFNDAPIAELPEWLFKFATSNRERQKEFSQSGARPDEATIAPLAKRIALAKRALRNTEPAIQGMNGSGACFKAAILLIRGYCLPSSDAFDLLWSDYNPVCQPSWSEWELMHKIEDAEHAVDIPWGYRLSLIGADGSVQVLQMPEVGIVPAKKELGDRIQMFSTGYPIAMDARRQAPKLPDKAALMIRGPGERVGSVGEVLVDLEEDLE